MNEPIWKAQVKGDPNGKSWEISVVHRENKHGQESWGWFDENKLLISHNGGPCDWPLAPGLGPMMIQLAERYAELLNKRDVQSLLAAKDLSQLLFPTGSEGEKK